MTKRTHDSVAKRGSGRCKLSDAVMMFVASESEGRKDLSR